MAAFLETSLNESNVMANFAGVVMNNKDSDEDIDDDDIRDIFGHSGDKEEWQTVIVEMCTSSDRSSDSDDATLGYNEEVDVEDGSSKRELVNNRQ